ncbi:A-macroglobulin complement component, partial [bacterium]|nr:A-macroglobulin complement component [bacterium]
MMRARPALRYLLIGSAVIATVAVISAGHVAGKATTASLGGSDRYLTALSTDKPIYRPGEKVYIRGVVLHAMDRKPLKDGRIHGFVEIKGPKGDTVASGHASGADSVFGFAWPVPKEQAGGEYSIKVTYPNYGFPTSERKFDIRAYRPPRLRSQIEFLRDGYGPGDEVAASLHVERAEGGIPAGAKVIAIARVDGRQVHRGEVSVDGEGNCTASFKLPAAIERGEGSLAMVVQDGGVVETASKTIPILLQTVDLQMYPEGGELVAGLPCRVYLEAKTPAKKPADIAGEIVVETVVGDVPGATAKVERVRVATFRTEHEGRGRFAFTPKAGGKYTLRITQPSGIKTTYPLPEVRAHGAVIQAAQDITPCERPVRLRVGSTDGGPLTVTLARREAEVSSVRWDATPGILADVVLTPPVTADGVLVATVWDDKSKPLAERLIYRRPARSLQVAVTAQRPSHVPGESVKLTVKTTDADGKPVGGVVGLTITDDSVLEMVEKREQAPRLPVMLLLEPEVKELADAHVYLDEKNPEAPRALDLLLGTQGWRRFAFVDATRFLATHGDAGRRVLALRMPVLREVRKMMRGKGAQWGLRLGGAAQGAAPGGEGADVERLGRLRDDKLDAGAPPPPAAKPGAPMPDVAAADEREADKDPAAKPAPEPARPAAGPVATPPPPKVPMAKERQRMAEVLEKAQKREEVAGLIVGQAVAKDALAERHLRRSNFAYIREYAHQARADRTPGDRRDFAETLFWAAAVKTDAKTGQATITFALSDAITTFRVFADAFGADGALGTGTAAVESVEPFYIEPKMPLEVTQGDVIQLPLSLVNGTPSPLPEAATVTTKTDPELTVSKTPPVRLPGDGRVRQVVEIKVGALNKPVPVEISATAGPYADKVTRTLSVKPRGFPVENASGGLLDKATPAAATITIPPDVVPRSITSHVAVYPTPLANLSEALERLIREPNGCFEQTSSSSYPLVMAQQYFLSHAGVNPELVRRSREKLDRAYKKLISFECKQRGYEWFGRGAGHEALTAYGLLQFDDMADVRHVDKEMIARTRKWLLDRRDGKGGFQVNKRALDSFGRAPEWTTNAYCIWALLENDEKGLEKEVDALYKHATSSKDSYVLALVANCAGLTGDKAGIRKFADRLAEQQAKDGHVQGAVTSITRSGGSALLI